MTSDDDKVQSTDKMTNNTQEWLELRVHCLGAPNSENQKSPGTISQNFQGCQNSTFWSYGAKNETYRNFWVGGGAHQKSGPTPMNP